MSNGFFYYLTNRSWVLDNPSYFFLFLPQILPFLFLYSLFICLYVGSWWKAWIRSRWWWWWWLWCRACKLKSSMRDGLCAMRVLGILVTGSTEYDYGTFLEFIAVFVWLLSSLGLLAVGYFCYIFIACLDGSTLELFISAQIVPHVFQSTRNIDFALELGFTCLRTIETCSNIYNKFRKCWFYKFAGICKNRGLRFK